MTGGTLKVEGKAFVGDVVEKLGFRFRVTRVIRREVELQPPPFDVTADTPVDARHVTWVRGRKLSALP